jgi:transketolase
MAGTTHTDMANAIRFLAADAVEAAKSGHPGMPMGMADVAAVLFGEVMRYDASAPDWPNRDRFVLSAGHGSMLLYSALHLTGYPGMSLDELKNFRQLGAKTAGHPEYGHAAGIETTTGPLGQGIANAVGMALAERLWNARLGSAAIEHHTWCIAGDGCLMEGISQEAITLAGHLGLGRLVVIFDDNAISIDGPTSLSTSEDQIGRFKAAGWNTVSIDGHDPAAIRKALLGAHADTTKPWLIAAKTIIGYGAPKKAGTAATHGSPLGADELAGARVKLGWPHAPFVVPDAVAKAWKVAGARGKAEREAWEQRWSKLDAAKRRAFEHPLDASRAAVDNVVSELKILAAADTTQRATRVWSERALEKLVPACPALIGGSADLTGSNNTKTKAQAVVSRGNFAGSYIHWGIREHGMAAAMNGLALSGFVPYGGTFLVFSDYCRPAIRLAALMQQQAIYVFTHDSIGLGEDGPTHQPVEHLAALRAIPNLNVFRPADGVETAECWAAALASTQSPSVLALTRQNVPNLRSAHTEENLSAKGAYVIAEGGKVGTTEGGKRPLPQGGKRDVTLLATGSEVGLAVEAAALLAEDGVHAAVVSMPCWSLFEAQSPEYRRSVLGSAPRIGIEAGIRQGWDRWLGDDGQFIGMTGFGASAPAPKLYAHFGLTAAAVATAAKSVVG